MNEKEFRNSGLDLLWAVSSWPGRVTAEAFANRPEAERRIAGLLEGLRYAYGYAVPELRKKIPQRNFDICIEGDQKKGLTISLAKDGQRYFLNQHLAPGYRFVGGFEAGGYCNATEKIVQVAEKKSDTASFPYDVLHETDHSHFSFIRNEPEFKEICWELDSLLRTGDISECEDLFNRLRTVVEQFRPFTSLASTQRDSMLQLLRQNIDINRFSVEDEKILGALERRAWKFAEQIVTMLEQKHGFDFGMSGKERYEYSRHCLTAYAIPRLQAALYREGEKGFQNYQSPFLEREEFDDRLKAAVSGCTYQPERSLIFDDVI